MNDEPTATDDRYPGIASPDPGRGGFLAREWFFVLIVGIALLVLGSALLSSPEPLDQEPAVLEAAPNTMEIMARLDQRPGLKYALYGFAGSGLLLFLAGLPLLGWFLWRRAEGVPLLGSTPGRSVRWGLWDVIKSAAVYFLLLTLLTSVTRSLLSDEAADNNSLVIVFAGNLLLTLFICLLVSRRDPGWLGALGLRPGGFWKRVRDGVVGYVAFFPLLAASALAAVLAAYLAGLTPEQNPLVPMVLGSDSIWFMLFLVFFGGLVGPITEEIFFRGFFYPTLRQRLGRVGAVLVNAFCFAALHGNLVQLAPLFGLGLILALLRERSGSVYASIALHCLHNTIVLSLLLTLKPVLV